MRLQRPAFLRRQTEIRPLNQKVSAEQFAHAQIVIEQALAQAVALNVVKTTNGEEMREPVYLYADDHLNLHNDGDDYEARNNLMEDSNKSNTGLRCSPPRQHHGSTPPFA